jgi:hypothetical protein
MPEPSDARVALPRAAWVLAALFGVAMVGLLATQVVLIEDQRRTVRTQREIAERQSRQALPLLEALRPLVDDVHGSLPEARVTGRRAGRLARDASALVADVRSAEPASALRATVALAGTLLRADVGSTLEGTGELARRLLADDLAGDVSAVASELGHRRRLRRLLRGSLSLLREMDRRDTLAKGERAAEATLRVERMTRRVLATQVRALEILEESLTIQRETERHAESLDRKTGPSPPAAAPAPVVPPG